MIYYIRIIFDIKIYYIRNTVIVESLYIRFQNQNFLTPKKVFFALKSFESVQIIPFEVFMQFENFNPFKRVDVPPEDTPTEDPLYLKVLP